MNVFTIFFALLLCTAFDGNSQSNASPPRSEFNLQLSTSMVQLKPGMAATVDVEFLRSKQYSRSKVLVGLSSDVPDGLSVTFDETEGIFQKTTLHLKASETVKPGTYLIIVKATMQNKSKGATLRVVLGDKAVDQATTSN